MNLSNRLQKLEKTEALVGPRPLMEQFERAIAEGEEDLFLQKLSDADLNTLKVECERIAFGDGGRR